MEIRTIGFIGLGIMGAPMSSNIAAKFDGKVLLCNRTHEKAQRLAQELSQYGAEAVEDKKELARRADLIITMVPRTVDSEAVYEEILPELGAGKICVDMSTIDPGRVERDCRENKTDRRAVCGRPGGEIQSGGHRRKARHLRRL